MLSVLHAPVRRCVLVLGGAPPATAVYFVWDAVDGATSYVLSIGPSTGSYTTYNSNVGNNLSAGVPLAAGTYYWIATPQGAGSATAEQTVTVA